MSFCHLHCHSADTLLDGANRVGDLIARAIGSRAALAVIPAQDVVYRTTGNVIKYGLR